MKLLEAQILFVKNTVTLINYIFESGYYCTYGETFRTKEQAAIYAEQGIGNINSLHSKRLAIDLNLFSPTGEYLTKTEDYEKFGYFWINLNPLNKWGGNFKRRDGNHFEYSPDGVA